MAELGRLQGLGAAIGLDAGKQECALAAVGAGELKPERAIVGTKVDAPERNIEWGGGVAGLRRCTFVISDLFPREIGDFGIGSRRQLKGGAKHAGHEIMEEAVARIG